MAPDLNAIGSGQRWDYSTPGSGGYNIPDIVYDVRGNDWNTSDLN